MMISMIIYRHAQYAVAICILTYRLSSRHSPESQRELQSPGLQVLILFDSSSSMEFDVDLWM